jgi:hypothetical protein
MSWQRIQHKREVRKEGMGRSRTERRRLQRGNEALERGGEGM